MKVYIFDLDDTLVRYSTKGAVVPRQTFHLLRRLHCEGHLILIVSYNPLCKIIALQTGLYKYAQFVVFGDSYRFLLVERALAKSKLSKQTEFFYIDDRFDNIACIKRHFTRATTILIPDPLLLYKQVNNFFQSNRLHI